MLQSVEDYLSGSRANALAALDIGLNRHVTIWENNNDRVSYDNTQGHAFSLYLKGGDGTRRLDQGAIAGYPGAVCVFPEGHRSNWEILSAHQFVHVYLPDGELRAAFSHIHDRDARLLDLEEMTFSTNTSLARPLMMAAQAALENAPLLADQALSELISGLQSTPVRLRGGLTPYVLRQIDEWINAELAEPIRLSDLAKLADLSEFHFHRMFQASRGVSPHQWVTMLRIERAKSLLGQTSIADVASACGFSNQSHLSRFFKRYTGMTPAVYAQKIRGS
jgi:AraC family transcriptional regulator